MISPGQIEDILSLYKKHGWNLRRVLLCGELKDSLDDATLEELFGESELTDAEINAAWFSRPSKRGKTAWELRHLSENPYAIFELSDTEDLDQAIVKQSENRLLEYASNKMSNKNA